MNGNYQCYYLEQFNNCSLGVTSKLLHVMIKLNNGNQL